MSPTEMMATPTQTPIAITADRAAWRDGEVAAPRVQGAGLGSSPQLGREEPISSVVAFPSDLRRAPAPSGRPAAAHAAASARDSRGRRSMFEAMAEVVLVISRSRQENLGLLLQAALPPRGRGRAVLAPLWANEAMQRAYDMILLVARLERTAPLGPGDHVAADMERRLASGLACTIGALDVADDNRSVPCSHLLRALVRDLVELFGPAAGHVRLRTSIEPLLLPAYKRRALVLAGCALVIDALGRRASGTSDGGITVTLTRVSEAQGLLRITDDARRSRSDGGVRSSDVIVDLASLLECEPVFRDRVGGVTIELAFPVDCAARAARPAPGRAPAQAARKFKVLA